VIGARRYSSSWEGRHTILAVWSTHGTTAEVAVGRRQIEAWHRRPAHRPKPRRERWVEGACSWCPRVGAVPLPMAMLELLGMKMIPRITIGSPHP